MRILWFFRRLAARLRRFVLRSPSPDAAPGEEPPGPNRRIWIFSNDGPDPRPASTYEDVPGPEDLAGPVRRRTRPGGPEPRSGDVACQVVWRDEALKAHAPGVESIWIDALRAAAVACRTILSRAGEVRVLVAHPGLVELGRFSLAPEGPDPFAVRALGYREQPLGADGYLGAVDALDADLGRPRRVAAVAAPGLSSDQADEWSLATRERGFQPLPVDRLHDALARACARAARASAGVLELPLAVWGARYPSRIELGAESSGRRRVFRLEPDWDARRLEFQHAPTRSPDDRGRFRTTLPRRRSDTRNAEVLLEFLYDGATGAAFARLWSDSTERPVCPVCASRRFRVSPRNGRVECSVCGVEAEDHYLHPTTRRTLLGLLRPGFGAEVGADIDAEPLSEAAAVRVCAGLDVRAVGRGYVQWLTGFVSGLAAAGRLGGVGLDVIGAGPGGRGAAFWSAEELRRERFPSRLVRALRGGEGLAPGRAFEECLRRTLTARPSATSGGVFGVLVSGAGHRLGPGSCLADDARRWAWVVDTRRALGAPLYLAAFVDGSGGPPPAEVTRPISRLVLLGRQATHAENLVRVWSDGDPVDEAVALVLRASESPRPKPAHLAAVVAEVRVET